MLHINIINSGLEKSGKSAGADPLRDKCRLGRLNWPLVFRGAGIRERGKEKAVRRKLPRERIPSNEEEFFPLHDPFRFVFSELRGPR